MPFLRPEALAQILRWREALGALGAVGIGLWMLLDPGPVVKGVGAVVTLVGLGLLVNALRRMRFVAGDQAPGVVLLNEGQISYLGPLTGGVMGLRDLVTLRLRTENKQKTWVMQDAEGNMLSIPHGAKGETVLFDAFAALPGMDMTALLANLNARAEGSVVVWQRTAAAPSLRLTSSSSRDTP
ncbi:hypothetical protein [Tropicimonas sp. S265A]|uniref:hypothetical protein n=1 Tax=Tropicimonas sp. S265A TaxID=3415134 RepID=UPI003C7BE7D1